MALWKHFTTRPLPVTAAKLKDIPKDDPQTFGDYLGDGDPEDWWVMDYQGYGHIFSDDEFKRRFSPCRKTAKVKP